MCWGHLEKSSASGIPHPHTAAFSFQEINSVRSALQEFGRGYTLPRAPGALEVSSPAQLWPRGAGRQGLCVPGHSARLGTSQGRARRPSEFIHSASVATVNRCCRARSLSQHWTEELVSGVYGAPAVCLGVVTEYP